MSRNCGKLHEILLLKREGDKNSTMSSGGPEEEELSNVVLPYYTKLRYHRIKVTVFLRELY